MQKVVVGIISDKNKQVLLTKRVVGKFMANYWELPGGKVEAGENELLALTRELKEELNISVMNAKHRLKIKHKYADREVFISVFDIISYSGDIIGNESQSLLWLDLLASNKLTQYQLLPTMDKVINSLKLSEVYWITPDNFNQEQLINKLNSGVRLVCFRYKQNIDAKKMQLLLASITICHKYKAKILLNIAKKYRSQDLINQTDGIHLSAQEAQQLKVRELAQNKLLAISTHNSAELAFAELVEADFVVLSPINTTTSHTNATPLGWHNAKNIIASSNIPVFALGGMSSGDLARAQDMGFFGIAGISKV